MTVCIEAKVIILNDTIASLKNGLCPICHSELGCMEKDRRGFLGLSIRWQTWCERCHKKYQLEWNRITHKYYSYRREWVLASDSTAWNLIIDEHELQLYRRSERIQRERYGE